MDKNNLRNRAVTFYSRKNSVLISVNTEFARDYANVLEHDYSIVIYESRVPLDCDHLASVSRVGIRASYFDETWFSDFRVQYANGKYGIRELVRRGDLDKLATAEKLELSRRYWQSLGVTDWRVVMKGGE